MARGEVISVLSNGVYLCYNAELLDDGNVRNGVDNRIVILTKVRTQGNGRCTLWLWVLTFVRMTE